MNYCVPSPALEASCNILLGRRGSWEKGVTEETQVQDIIPGSEHRVGWGHLSQNSRVAVWDSVNPAQKQEQRSALASQCVHWSKFVILAFLTPFEYESSNPYCPRVEAIAG